MCLAYEAQSYVQLSNCRHFSRHFFAIYRVAPQDLGIDGAVAVLVEEGEGLLEFGLLGITQFVHHLVSPLRS